MDAPNARVEYAIRGLSCLVLVYWTLVGLKYVHTSTEWIPSHSHLALGCGVFHDCVHALNARTVEIALPYGVHTWLQSTVRGMLLTSLPWSVQVCNIWGSGSISSTDIRSVANCTLSIARSIQLPSQDVVQCERENCHHLLCASARAYMYLYSTVSYCMVQYSTCYDRLVIGQSRLSTEYSVSRAFKGLLQGHTLNGLRVLPCYHIRSAWQREGIPVTT